MSGAERHVVTGTTPPKHEGGEREYFTAIVVLASDYDLLQAERDELRVQVEAMRALLSGVCDYADGLLCEVNSAWAYGGSTGPNAVHEDADYLASRAAIQAKP